MSDLIDRQAAIDQLHQSYNLLDAEQRLEDLPPTQPEFIRCKDCKHFNSYFVECDHGSGLKHIKDDHDHCCHADRGMENSDL